MPNGTSASEIRFLGIPVKVVWEVIDYAAHERIGVKTVKGPVSVEAQYTFEATNGNQTKVTVQGEADLGDVFGLADPIVERMAQRQWAVSFENLKDVLEAIPAS